MESENLNQYLLLFNLLEYWDREWRKNMTDTWIRFEACDINDPDTLVGLDYQGSFPPPSPRAKNPSQRFSFDPKQIVDSSITNLCFFDSFGELVEVDVRELDRFKGEVTVAWNTNAENSGVRPENIKTLTSYSWFPPRKKREALLKFADDFLENPESEIVSFALFRREPPALSIDLKDKKFQPDLDHLKKTASALNNSYLAIQGPPGTGKTWAGARIIHHLVTVEKKRVGITAQSWSAIENLLEATVKVFEKERNENLESGLEPLKAVLRKPKPKDKEPIEGVTYTTNDKGNLFADFDLVASTTWFWAHEDFNEENKFDYLVIDEAGQLALVDALVSANGARNLLLLGDPQQLSQVTQASHPFRAGVSVFEHILNDKDTIENDRGVLLDKTFRLRPEICEFISDQFYDEKLTYDITCEKRKLVKGENGLLWHPVSHEQDCVNQSEEEAKVVAEIISELLGSEWKTINQENDSPTEESKKLAVDDFMVVAPYNAQVRMIQTKLLTSDIDGIDKDTVKGMVGTVDKFQGREAPVVIYSLTTSRQELAPKGRKDDFLFSPNRLNVAVSRAQCLTYIVGTEELISTRANSISEMKALNHFCRYVDDLSEKIQA
ncbi:MAG: RecBCD enzyme subunit RecD [Acidimicrobiaceae bacterium]|nr:MAG: RecBCD enzyme subunit RecD [Acidimicrobiaceae bacterium]